MKTNALRILDKENIPYQIFEYEVDEKDLSGVSTAKKIGQNEELLFKTLVLKTDKKEIIVCCIPVAQELDLKKIARCSNAKSVEMLPMKDLLATCGYIRGACSPIGMKKQFPTYVDETCILFDEIFISAGVRGMMIKINREALLSFVKAKCFDLCKE